MLETFKMIINMVMESCMKINNVSIKDIGWMETI